MRSTWAAAFLAGGAMTLAACSSGSATAGSAPSAPTPNLLPNSALDQGVDLRGLAAGVTAWGASQVTAGGPSVIAGTGSESITVPPGHTGGIYIQVGVPRITAYTESAYVDVVSLEPVATAAMIVEWYDRNLNLLGYQMDRMNIAGRGFDRRVQTVRAPARTAIARFVANVAGGGTIVLNAPQLQVGTTASPFQVTPPETAGVALRSP